MTTHVDVQERIAAVAAMPFGAARTQAAEHELARVLALPIPELVAAAHAAVVHSLIGAHEIAAAHDRFRAHLRWWDTSPEHFDDVDHGVLLRTYELLLDFMISDPRAPARAIDDALVDLARRCTVGERVAHSVAHRRWRWASARGRDADEAYEAWVLTPRDHTAMCAHCEPPWHATHMFDTGRDVEGIEILEYALLELPADHEPTSMLSLLQLALLRQGRLEDAAAAHELATAGTGRSPGSASTWAHHVSYLARTGRADDALRILETGVVDLRAAPTAAVRLDLLTHVGTATTVLSAADPRRRVEVPGVRATTVATLHAWVRAEGRLLAGAFDRRNGTDRRRRLLTEAWDLTATRPGRGPTPVPRAAEPQSTTLADARRAEQTGRLEDAAWLWLDAAEEARASGADDDALRAFDRGFTLADVAGVATTALVTPLRSMAQVCDRAGAHRRGLDTLAERLHRLDTAATADAQGPPTPGRELLRWARTEVLDSTARLNAAVGEHRLAAGQAQEAAAAFAELGVLASAAHAWWLAGRMHRALRQSSTAAWFLGRAVDGLRAAGDVVGAEQAAHELASLASASRRTTGPADADDPDDGRPGR